MFIEKVNSNQSVLNVIGFFLVLKVNPMLTDKNPVLRQSYSFTGAESQFWSKIIFPILNNVYNA